ncbi:hypothetical protein WKK05_15740 [Nostoc sp. UHCC 0302]|uniref:hypothetical protein n=1 Tax=Nostoc sp. UHCC 0302 TaxID=3134896 RepID=UPI00311CC0B1
MRSLHQYLRRASLILVLDKQGAIADFQKALNLFLEQGNTDTGSQKKGLSIFAKGLLVELCE